MKCITKLSILGEIFKVKFVIRIYKSKWFAKFAKKEIITDNALCKAIKDAEDGKIDADLGGGVIKQRIARENAGKSGGYRSIILYRYADKAFFVYGYSKSKQDNISKAEVLAFRDMAELVLSLPESEVEILLKAGIYEEVKSYEKD